MKRLLLAPLAALLACGPTPVPPVQVMALVPNETGAYATVQVELKTASNLSNLKGSVAELMGGNRVVVDANDPLQSSLPSLTDEQRYEVIVKDKGADVRGNYIERAGVYWPGDFHTWNMVSAYYNFERSYEYFVGIYDGVEPTELQRMKVMYWANVRLNTAEPITDNALYLSFIKSFVIVPFQTQKLVPLAMNIGVIGHEVAHRSFNFRVLADAGISPALTTWNGQAFNLLKSIDEGFADFHGFGVTCGEAAGCRPNYLAASLSDQAIVDMRNVARTDACMDENTRNAFNNDSPDQWVRSSNMYKVGNLWAAAMYQAGNKVGNIGLMQKSLFLAYNDASSTTPGLSQLVNSNINTQQAFTPEAVANTIVAHVSDPQLKKELCNEFSTRLQLKCGAFPCPEMPACPATSARQNFCPTLPQP
ncbi:MAG: hypothetical protein AB1938_16740 [Myxococcota bacterium]